MLELIDRLACRWLDWRTDHTIKNDPALQEFGLKRMSVTPDGWEMTFVTPAAVMIADEMAAMLDEANAENFVQFDFMPRLDRGKRPVRVTVRWAWGMSPAEKCAVLEAELEAHHAVADAAQAVSDGARDHVPFDVMGLALLQLGDELDALRKVRGE